MQHPIIDLINQACINNEWTGLNIDILSTNLFCGNNNEFYPLFLPANTIVTASAVNSNYTRIEYYDANKNRIDYWWLQGTGNRKFATFTLLRDTYYFKFMLDDDREMMITTDNSYDPFVPFKSTSDFPNRLKLPLLHYFPHPVIDALERAAAGTQTADDTEILKHYLTPLGIGGI